MLFFVNASFIFVFLLNNFVCASTIKFQSDKFIKSNMYSEENILIYSNVVRSRLGCSLYCAMIKNCSMITTETIEGERFPDSRDDR